MAFRILPTDQRQSAEGHSNTTDANGKVMITSVATGPGNSKAIVQIVVTSFPPLQSGNRLLPRQRYSNGTSISISGNEPVTPATSLAPIYTKDPATTTRTAPQFTGSPPTPQHGTRASIPTTPRR